MEQQQRGILVRRPVRLSAIKLVKFASSVPEIDDSMSVSSFNFLANNIIGSPIQVHEKDSYCNATRQGRQRPVVGRDLCRTTTIDIYGRLLNGKDYCRLRKNLVLSLQINIIKNFMRM